MFRDAAIVHDEGGSDAALFAVLLVVIDLDNRDAAPVRERNRDPGPDRVACVIDDSYFSTSHVDQAETWHAH